MIRKVLLFAIVVSTSLVQAQKATQFAIKSGYIKLELSGNTTGTKEIWWDDYGTKYRELEHSTTTTKIFGMKSTEEKHTLNIQVEDKFWTVDYMNNTASKGINEAYRNAQEMTNSMTDAQREQMASQMYESMGGQKLQNESVGGYNCEVYSVMGSKSWIYKGVVLKSSSKVLGITIDESFTEFKPNTPVSSANFQPPANFQYEDLTDRQADFLGSLNMMGDMEGYDQDYENDDDDEVPVRYPFEKFQRVIGGLSIPDYRNMGVNNVEGNYAAAYMKGISETIMITATSRQNAGAGEHDDYETFSSNGHKCYYGNVEEEDGSALVIDYPAYDMYISIVAMPDMSKSELLKISEKLKF